MKLPFKPEERVEMVQLAQAAAPEETPFWEEVAARLSESAVEVEKREVKD